MNINIWWRDCRWKLIQVHLHLFLMSINVHRNKELKNENVPYMRLWGSTWALSSLLPGLRLSVLGDPRPVRAPGQQASQRLPVWVRSLPADLAHDDVERGAPLTAAVPPPLTLWPMRGRKQFRMDKTKNTFRCPLNQDEVIINAIS